MDLVGEFPYINIIILFSFESKRMEGGIAGNKKIILDARAIKIEIRDKRNGFSWENFKNLLIEFHLIFIVFLEKICYNKND